MAMHKDPPVSAGMFQRFVSVAAARHDLEPRQFFTSLSFDPADLKTVFSVHCRRCDAKVKIEDVSMIHGKGLVLANHIYGIVQKHKHCGTPAVEPPIMKPVSVKLPDVVDLNPKRKVIL